MFRKYKKRIIFSIIFGALVYLGLSVYAKFDELLIAFSKFHWWMIFPVLLLSLINYYFRFLKWDYYTKILDVAPKHNTNLLIFLASFVMSVTPGKLGEVLKSYLLNEVNGTPVSKSAPIVLAERITDFVSLIMLSIIGAFLFGIGKGLMIIVGVGFIILIIVLGSKKLSYGIINSFERFKFFEKISHKVHEAYDSIFRLVKIKPLLIAILISICAWSAECFGTYIVIHSFGIENLTQIDIFVATFIYGFATIAGAITMLPGGLGVTDASMPLLIVKISQGQMSESVAIAATIIIRLATLWFAVIIGIIALLFYQKLSYKNINEIALEN